MAGEYRSSAPRGGGFAVVYSYLGPEGVGCYWYRQHQYCARYCYVEVDGYRYCREEQRDAYSQAPYSGPRPDDGKAGPMKLGRSTR
jgi:hypothetical protein